MLGKFYTTTQNVVNAESLIPLNSCRTCGGGFRLIDGNAIEICKSDLYYFVEGKPQGKVWEVMAELVDSIKVFQPKVYEELMRRLSDI